MTRTLDLAGEVPSSQPLREFLRVFGRVHADGRVLGHGAWIGLTVVTEGNRIPAKL